MAVGTAAPTVPGHGRIARMAAPIILANCAAPLLGLSDTAVIGHFGTTADLGAIALGSLLLNFIFWSFGFLRMGTTAFVAQALGRRDNGEATATVVRGLAIAVAIGLMLILLQWPLAELALRLFGASTEVEATARDYFSIRIWSAPATLCLYVLMGYLIGCGASGRLLALQLLLNGSNLLLDLLFAGVLGWGAAGVALGTAIAEWSTLAVAVWAVYRMLDRSPLQLPAAALRRLILAPAKLRRMTSVNANIMVRTLFLLLGFALFTDQGARFGDTVLAANHILLQLISFSAFFLDGFAFTTEALAGQAFGARRRDHFRTVVARATLLAAVTALALAVALLLGGPLLIAALTQLEPVRVTAITYMPFCSAYVLLSFAAFQLDGIFLGTARGAPLRNASIAATVLFGSLCWLLIPPYGNQGLWLAFIGYVCLRAIMLGLQLPALVRRLDGVGVEGALEREKREQR